MVKSRGQGPATMRPQSLTHLFAQTTSLPGIGPRLGKLVEKLAGPLVVDLLWHLPFAVVDRRNAPEVAHAKAGEIATDRDRRRAPAPRNPRQPYRVWCSDETGGSASPTSTAARTT